MGFLKEFAKGFGQGYIEQRGIDVALRGSGRVVAQSLPHGTQITPGTSIILSLKI